MDKMKIILVTLSSILLTSLVFLFVVLLYEMGPVFFFNLPNCTRQYGTVRPLIKGYLDGMYMASSHNISVKKNKEKCNEQFDGAKLTGVDYDWFSGQSSKNCSFSKLFFKKF